MHENNGIKSKLTRIITSPIMFTILVFTIIFLGNCVYWLAYFPGGFNLDSYGQWMQAHGDMPFNNWHPFFVTSIYWLLVRIQDSFSFCICFQLVLFSLSLSCLLCKIGTIIHNQTIIYFVAAIESINPAICINNISLIKDVYFTIGVIWLIYFMIGVYLTQGKCLWGYTGVMVVLFSIMTILTRHNAILFVLPMLCSMLFLLKEERKVCMIITIVTLVVAIFVEGPLFTLLGVRHHDNPTAEVIGVPMAIMVNAFLEEEDQCPEEVRKFLLEKADYDEWDYYYNTGEWDSVRWDIGGAQFLEDESIWKIYLLGIKTAIACPRSAIMSFLWNTRMVWQALGKVDWESRAFIEKNKYNIVPDYNPICRFIIDNIMKLSLTFIGATLVWNLGWIMLLIVWGIYYAYKNEKTKALFLIPLLSYNVLTMLLLAGPNYRYFYYNQVILFAVALIVIEFKRNENEIGEEAYGFSGD